MGFLCAFILLSSIGFGISRADASNVYISEIQFYKDSNNIVRVKFFVNTSFDVSIGPKQGLVEHDYRSCLISGGYSFGRYISPAVGALRAYQLAPIDNPEDNLICNTEFHYIAGHTYNNIIAPGGVVQVEDDSDKICVGQCQSNCDYGSSFSAFPSRPISTDYITDTFYQNNISFPNSDWPGPTDTEKYYFITAPPAPTLDITFPLENAEISEAFYITGSYTILENSGVERIVAFFYGDGLSYPWYSFHQNLIDLSGSISIRSSGIQASDYTIKFCFVGTGIEAICPVENYINISIVDRIPPELPDGEIPPEVYDPIDADQFYLDFSEYETPTALYSNLKNAIQPIFTTIGSNLTFFTSRFDSQTAKDTGEKTGQAILIIRTYSSNLNTFFNDLPVSEFLLFYLSLLIVVIVFRIIKNLINLIKP